MKSTNIYTSIGIVFLFLLITQPAFTQFQLSTSIHTSYDDNISNNHLNIKDKVAQFSLSSAYDFTSEESNTQLFYMGSFNYFNKAIDRTFNAHSAGLVYTNLFGEDLESALNLGGTYNTRSNRSSYTLINYNQYTAYINAKHYLGERVVGKLGYRLKYLGYEELQELSNLENYGFAQVTTFLPSKTTLIFETGLGLKTYTNAPPETLSTIGSGRPRQTLNETSPSVIQFIGTVRAAQSIFENTGLSFAMQYQKNLQEETRYLSSGYMISDDEIFDDNYGYEGTSFELTLTQILPWSMMSSLSASYGNKNYVNRPAYDLNDNIISNQRVDKLFVTSFMLEKTFSTSGFINNFSISLLYDYIDNNSNDLFYKHKNNVGAINFEFGF